MQRLLGRISFVICGTVVVMGAMISTPASATIQRGETTVWSVHAVSHVATTGSISGTVTAASGGAPLASICVDAYVVGGINSGSATTASDGTYAISGLAVGSYVVLFYPGCGNGGYAPQWYNGTSSGAALQSGALAIMVTAGSSTTAINAEMGAGATISGTVTAASGGAPLAGICVNADTGGGGFNSGCATTASDGTYTISGLAGGSYDVEFLTGFPNGGDYLAQWYNSTTAGAPLLSGATAITVTAGSTTTAINAEMVAGATISGTVTAASGGAPLTGICVTAWLVGGPGISTTTASDGTYTINGTYTISGLARFNGLAAGSYDVEFSTRCGNRGNYAPQWYNGTNSGAALQSGALAITVTAGSSTTGINAEMGAQSISFTSTNPGSKTVGATSYTPTASATSGLPVTISLDPSSTGCSLTSGVVSFTGVGTCIIDANQAGDASYSAASQVHQSVTVTMALPARPATITVAFAAKSSALSARAKKALQALSKKLTTLASVNITGYAKGNTTLAKSRAKVVANYLSSRVALHVTLKFVTRTSENRVTVATTKQ